LIVWECAVKGKTRLPIDEVIDSCAWWLQSETKYAEIQGAKGPENSG